MFCSRSLSYSFKPINSTSSALRDELDREFALALSSGKRKKKKVDEYVCWSVDALSTILPSLINNQIDIRNWKRIQMR